MRQADPRVRAWNDRPIARGDYVVYWSQASRRASDNVALELAIARANELSVPVVVYESLRPDYPHASDRVHTFVLECARDSAKALAARGIAHGFFLPKTADEARGVAARVFSRACLIVSDEHPSFVFPAQNRAAAARAPCAYLTVDDAALVPLSRIPSHESQARTIRGKLLAELPTWLFPVEPIAPKKSGIAIEWPFTPIDLARSKLDRLVAGCAIDHAVRPIAERPGGEGAARARLEAFLAHAARAYDEGKEDALVEGTSGLSPYLHFGAITPRACLLAMRDAVIPEASRVAFVEQLVVRRGLAFNHAARCADHARFEGVPGWARATLAAHERDPRPDARDVEELKAGASGDPLWNAAQRELVTRGRIHNAVRMFWGKRLLSLIERPRDAFDFAVDMFDRFALDGRDPNTYAGVGWCFGLHDRPFPERAIFGVVRPMGRGALARRFDVDRYIASIDAALR